MGNDAIKIYPHPLCPEKYPLFEERHARAVTRKALEDEIQFTALRGFTTDEEGNLTDYKNLIELYVERFRLGKVIWPVYTTLLTNNFKELVDCIAEKGLYLFDFWGYVPGSKPEQNTIWGEYVIPPEYIEYMRAKLGDHFLGFDNGEQDGRYVGRFANQQMPLSFDRKAQYRNFQKHFQALGDAMNHDTVVLSSLTFLHYFAKEGNAIMLGAETAQALPNDNMWFSFIRGAAKQYGLLYFGNASVWNRWGYKCYESSGQNGSVEWGPESGTSLSLLRRLMYSQYMYNCDVLGFEQSWLMEDNTEKRITGQSVGVDEKAHACTLSPVGRVQQYAAEFVKQQGRPGVMYTPLAIIADFFSGWVPPRHLYTADVYKVWGNLPYETGDYQLDLLFGMLYPGYENAGFYRDERGFLCATPFGEISDVLLSDAGVEVMQQYSTLLVTSGTQLSYELLDKFEKAALNGGNVIFFADTLQKYDREIAQYSGQLRFLTGIESFGTAEKLTDTSVRFDGKDYPCPSLELSSCVTASGVRVCAATREGKPVIIENRVKKGTVSVILASGGIFRNEIPYDSKNQVNTEIVKPFDFYPFVRAYLANAFSALRVIWPNNAGLQYILCSKSAADFTMLVSNNTWIQQSFNLTSAFQSPFTAEEIPVSDFVTGSEGFFPACVKPQDTPAGTADYRIDAGDIKLFKISLQSDRIELMAESIPRPKEKGLYLAKPDDIGIKEFVLNNPGFQQTFSGVQVGAGYLERTDRRTVEAESAYLNRQKLKLIVDFTPMLNHYPDFSVFRNLPEKYEETINRIESMIQKASHYDTTALIFSLHCNAECSLPVEAAVEQFIDFMKETGRIAEAHGLNVYVQNRPSFISAESLCGMVRENLPGIRFAYNTSFGICADESYDELSQAANQDGLIISAPFEDGFRQLYPAGLPVWNSAYAQRIKDLFSLRKTKNFDFVSLAGHYSSDNDLYADLKYLFGR